MDRGLEKKGMEALQQTTRENLDLVQRHDALLQQHNVSWRWIKGHSGEPGNEFVDNIANVGMDNIAAGRTPKWEQRFNHVPVPL